jgi:hypothetical protein
MDLTINLRQDFWINRKISKLRSRSNWRLSIEARTRERERVSLISKSIGRTIITMINLNIYQYNNNKI